MARLDTGWHEHPKILGLGLAGMGLHAWSISYCDATRSDGFIPNGAWPTLRGMRETVQKLVRSGVWVPAEGGYRVHDYTVYNRTKEQIETHLEETRQRKARERSSRRTTSGHPAGQSPESTPESGRNPRAPGPGPLSNSVSSDLNPAGPARQAPRAYARETAESPELLAEHLKRIADERASHARPRQPSEESSGDDGAGR